MSIISEVLAHESHRELFEEILQSMGTSVAAVAKEAEALVATALQRNAARGAAENDDSVGPLPWAATAVVAALAVAVQWARYNSRSIDGAQAAVLLLGLAICGSPLMDVIGGPLRLAMTADTGR